MSTLSTLRADAQRLAARFEEVATLLTQASIALGQGSLQRPAWVNSFWLYIRNSTLFGRLFLTKRKSSLARTPFRTSPRPSPSSSDFWRAVIRQLPRRLDVVLSACWIRCLPSGTGRILSLAPCWRASVPPRNCVPRSSSTRFLPNTPTRHALKVGLTRWPGPRGRLVNQMKCAGNAGAD